MKTVKYMDTMKEEIQKIVQKSAVGADRQKREDLSNPTTTYFLHRNLMEMRSLYNKDTAPVEKIPEFTTTEKAANRQNFTANYDKLTDMTKFKKIIESTETLQPILNDHDGKQGKGKYPLRELKESGQMIVGLQQHLDE